MLIFEMTEMEHASKNKQHSLEIKFLQFISKENLIHKNDNLLLGLSGGKDSICLFHLLRHFKFKFSCAHVNFKLRDHESDADEAFVRKLCKQHKIKLHTAAFDTQKIAKKLKSSTQMAARDLRYDWFKKLADEHHYTKILIAHNLQDNTETILLNLTRGTGLDGLIGLKSKNASIVRPLLFADIDLILSYLKSRRLKYREDSSNAALKYKRNSIRQEVVPKLLLLNPNLNQTLYENAQHLLDLQNFLQASFESFKTYFIEGTESQQILTIQKNLPSYFLQSWLKPYGFNASQIDAAFQLLNSNSSGKYMNAYPYQLIKNRQQLILSKIEKQTKIEIDFKDFEALQQYAGFKVELIAGPHLKTLKVEANTALLDYDKIQFPLQLSQNYKNEKFKPFGLNHFVKVSDFLIQKKMSSIEKSKVLLLKQNDKVLWLVNHRSDERFKISKSTQSILKISTH
jgi:tRNA(Ile)-lysidine synthase